MATYNRFNSFPGNVLKGKHNFTSEATAAVTVALVATANTPTATMDELGDLTQVSYTYCSTRVVATVSIDEATAGTAKLILSDLTLTGQAGGVVGPFQYVVVYDDTPSGDPLIGWFDYGAPITLNVGETLLIDFADVAGGGLLNIAPAA